MTATEIVCEVARALKAAEINYLLVGSFSSNIYAVPRSTKDADFVVQVTGAQLLRLKSCLGERYRLDSQLRFEGVTGTLKNLIEVVDAEFEIELFRLSDDPHDQTRFERRVENTSLGCSVWIPTAEDVIVTKLRWAVAANRSKDRDDIRDVISVQASRLDWDYIHRWAEVHETRACLDEIVRSIPPDLLEGK